MQNGHLQASHAKKKNDRTTESRNGKVTELKLIKHDSVLQELKEF